MPPARQDPVKELVDELDASRAQLLAALDRLSPEQRKQRRLVGEWGVPEIIAHLGYWAGNAAEALHYAEQDRTDEFGEDSLSVEERNAVVARVARETSLATVRAREEAAFEALRSRLQHANPDWLDQTVSYGDTVGYVVRDDGPDHYREHALDLEALAQTEATDR